MIELTVREYEQLPSIYDDEDNINDIRNLSVGDRYIVRESDTYVEKGVIMSVYEVISKKTDLRVESKVVMVKII